MFILLLQTGYSQDNKSIVDSINLRLNQYIGLGFNLKVSEAGVAILAENTNSPRAELREYRVFQLSDVKYELDSTGYSKTGKVLFVIRCKDHKCISSIAANKGATPIFVNSWVPGTEYRLSLWRAKILVDLFKRLK